MNDSPIIGVIDSDSFEVSIYQKLAEYQHTIGSPCVVSIGHQLNRIVSVSPEAKRKGISRSMTVPEAIQKLPNLIVIPKTSQFNKPESKRLRTASYEFRDTILEFLNWHAPDYCLEDDGDDGDDEKSNVVLEINGNDEYFLDLTRPVELLFECMETHELDTRRKVIVECKQGRYYGTRLNNIQRHGFFGPEDFEDDLPGLAYGAFIMQQLCEFVKDKTGYTCSAGVGVNKVMAKIACKLHKPEAVVALTPGAIPRVAKDFKYREITGLGGSLGDRVSVLFGNELTMAKLKSICTSPSNSPELQMMKNQFTEEEINKVTDLSKGICTSKVEQRLTNKSVSSGKNNLYLNGKDGYTVLENVMTDLAAEMEDRIQEEFEWNKRKATGLKFVYEYYTGNPKNKEVSFPLKEFQFGSNAEAIKREAWNNAVTRNTEIQNHLGSIVGAKFVVAKFDVIDDIVELVKKRVLSERTRMWHMKSTTGLRPTSALRLEDLVTGYEFPVYDD